MTGGGTSRTTIHHVAARAGVSIATVSRVLTGSRPVTPELQARVTAAALELGYSANLLGRALRQGRSFSVGLIMPDLENPFFAALAQQTSAAFAVADIDVHICSANNDLGLERRAVESFLGRQADAIVIVPCDEKASAPSVRLAHRTVLTIQLDRLARSVRTHYVGCDNEHGVALIAQHIRESVDLTRQRPVLVGASPTSSTAHERLDALSAAFPEAEQILGTYSFGTGRDAMDQLLARGVRSATVIAAADIIALGALAAAQHGRARVPRDFRVTGFDDVGVSYLAQPPLTTVRQPVDEMTAALVELVKGQFEGSGAPSPVVIKAKPTLVVRESSPGRRVSAAVAARAGSRD